MDSIGEATIAGMKSIQIFAIVMALAGCSSITVERPDGGKYTYQRLFTNLKLGSMTITSGTDDAGNPSVSVSVSDLSIEERLTALLAEAMKAKP